MRVGEQLILQNSQIRQENALIRPRYRSATFIFALRAAFGGCAPKRACGRSPRRRLGNGSLRIYEGARMHIKFYKNEEIL